MGVETHATGVENRKLFSILCKSAKHLKQPACAFSAFRPRPFPFCQEIQIGCSSISGSSGSCDWMVPYNNNNNNNTDHNPNPKFDKRTVSPED